MNENIHLTTTLLSSDSRKKHPPPNAGIDSSYLEREGIHDEVFQTGPARQGEVELLSLRDTCIIWSSQERGNVYIVEGRFGSVTMYIAEYFKLTVESAMILWILL